MSCSSSSSFLFSSDDDTPDGVCLKNAKRQATSQKWQKAKANNKYKKNCININDYGKILSISTNQIDKMMEDLQECFGVKSVNTVQTVSIFQDLVSIPIIPIVKEMVTVTIEEPPKPKIKVSLAMLQGFKNSSTFQEPSDVLF
jgi:hypothetical protein